MFTYGASDTYQQNVGERIRENYPASVADVPYTNCEGELRDVLVIPSVLRVPDAAQFKLHAVYPIQKPIQESPGSFKNM